jgi:hypothetical protein
LVHSNSALIEAFSHDVITTSVNSSISQKSGVPGGSASLNSKIKKRDL